MNDPVNMREKVSPHPAASQVLSSPFADRVRDAVSVRCSELEELNPTALDLASEVVAALHDELHGEAVAHRGNRGAGYFRQQLRGEHPITVEDLSRLTLENPRAVAPAIAILVRRLGFVLTPVRPQSPGIHEANAAVAAQAGATIAGIARALADGHLDPAERSELAPQVRELKRVVTNLEAAVSQ